jgi:hypothetical protein
MTAHLKNPAVRRVLPVRQEVLIPLRRRQGARSFAFALLPRSRRSLLGRDLREPLLRIIAQEFRLDWRLLPKISEPVLSNQHGKRITAALPGHDRIPAIIQLHSSGQIFHIAFASTIGDCADIEVGHGCEAKMWVPDRPDSGIPGGAPNKLALARSYRLQLIC